MKRNLIILGCLLAVAVGLALALTVLNRMDAPAIEITEGETFPLYGWEEPVASLTVTEHSGASYTLEGVTYSDILVQTAALAGREDWIVDQSRIVGVLNASRRLLALQEVDDSPRNLEDYGLDHPRVTVELIARSGEALTLKIGDNAPGNVGIYLQLSGTPSVWLVPAYELENYLRPETFYLNHTITDGNPLSESFIRITLGGTAREEQGDIVVEQRNGGYSITSPISQPVDEDEPLQMLRAIFGMQADSVAIADPTPQDLAALGLDEPYSTAEVESGVGSFKIYASAPDLGGNVYLCREGVPLVYAVQQSLLPWLELQYTDLMDPYAFTPDIDSLGQVEVVEGDAVYLFELDGAGVSLGGRALDSENFQRFYITLISARLAEHTGEAPPQGDLPALVFRYHYQNGQTHEVAFYKGPPRRYFIRVDSGPCFLTPSAYVDKVAEDVAKVTAGQTVESYSY